MNEPINTAFTDKRSDENLENGLAYHAVGLISADFTDEKPEPTDKDYTVSYIDPWGIVQNEWRSRDDIELIKLDKSDYEHLLFRIKEIEKTGKIMVKAMAASTDKEIEVEKCEGCPFFKNEGPLHVCRIDSKKNEPFFDAMSFAASTVEENCPLKSGPITVRLKG